MRFTILWAVSAIAATAAFCAYGETTDPKTDEIYRSKALERRQELQKKIDKGDATALTDMAALLEQGDDSAPADRTKAFDLYEQAATLNNDTARHKLCLAYLLGEGRPFDLQKGLNTCYDLPKTDPAYIFASAYDYDHGVTGPKNEATALQLYLEDIKNGSGESADAVGQKAITMGQDQNALFWFRQGVFLGSVDAMEHMAEMLEAGKGGPEDPKEAAWLRGIAAERGNNAAQAWQQAHEKSPKLETVTLSEGASEMNLTRHYAKDGKTLTEPMAVSILAKRLTGSYPKRALDARVAGRATISCYINALHEADACVITREYPPGYDFGYTLTQLFDAQISVDATDAVGKPTQGKLMVLTLNWVLDVPTNRTIKPPHTR